VHLKKATSWCVVWILLGLSLIIAYGVCVEPYRIEVHHVWISDKYLGKVLEKKVVVQLSDLHVSKMGKREQTVLKILDNLKPDFVFLTGDYVGWHSDYRGALDFLSQLKAKSGIWAVMGDYDYSNTRKSCLFCHEEGTGKSSLRHSVRFLRDTIEPVSSEEGTFWIGGIDIERKDLISSTGGVLSLPGKKPLIILSHNPLFFDRIDREQEVLVLAGDTHGGQIPMPSWLLIALGYRKNALYSQGLFQTGRKKMFVSRGIGTSHVPVRILRQPEVTVLHFRE